MKNAILSVLRHLLTFGGGAVIANNPGISGAAVENISGAVIGLSGLLWGAFDEYKAEKSIRKSDLYSSRD